MNAVDILNYGHQTILRAIEGLPEADWDIPGVAGKASVKDLIGHLASLEHILVEVAGTFLEGGPTPYLDQFLQFSVQFNDLQIAQRKGESVTEIFAEYSNTCAQAIALVSRISPEMLRQTGTLPWYGLEYSLDDFIVYTYYGHKREHSAQIEVFRDRLSSSSPV